MVRNCVSMLRMDCEFMNFLKQPQQIIFGAGNKGRMLLRMLEQGGGSPSIHCFIDSDPAKWGSSIGSYLVYPPDYLITLARHSFRVLVAVGPGYSEARDRLTGYGLAENVDFVDACIAPATPSALDEEYRKAHDLARDHTLLSDERLQVLYQFARATSHLPGDAAEVGVYRGGTAFLMATLFSKQDKRLHLFDTFSGIPAVTENIDLHLEGDFSDTSLSVVADFLREFDGISFHSGVFPVSVTPEAEAASYCFVHVDADMYRSVLDSCAFFYPRLAQGGIILFDDYGFASCPGVRKAVDEFFADKRHKPVYLPTGQALAINS
jgi:O-methyltransferase